MKRNITLLAAVAAVLSLCACTTRAEATAAPAAALAGDDVRTYTIDVDRVEAVRVDWVADVVWTQGERTEVRVETKPDIYEQAKITCDNGVLVVAKKDNGQTTNDNNLGRDKRQCIIYVTSPRLERVEIRGVSGFRTDGPVQLEKMTCRLLGVAHVTMDNARIDDLRIDVGGVGNLDLTVTCGKQADFSVNGVCNGNVAMDGKACKVATNGVSNLTFNVDCRTLDVTHNGLGDLKVKGLADKVKIGGEGISSVDTSDLNR